jgi:hypothetical protein
MLPTGFEPTISASQRPQTHDLYRAATEFGVSATDSVDTDQAVRVEHHCASGSVSHYL